MGSCRRGRRLELREHVDRRLHGGDRFDRPAVGRELRGQIQQRVRDRGHIGAGGRGPPVHVDRFGRGLQSRLHPVGVEQAQRQGMERQREQGPMGGCRRGRWFDPAGAHRPTPGRGRSLRRAGRGSRAARTDSAAGSRSRAHRRRRPPLGGIPPPLRPRVAEPPTPAELRASAAPGYGAPARTRPDGRLPPRAPLEPAEHIDRRLHGGDRVDGPAVGRELRGQIQQRLRDRGHIGAGGRRSPVHFHRFGRGLQSRLHPLSFEQAQRQGMERQREQGPMGGCRRGRRLEPAEHIDRPLRRSDRVDGPPVGCQLRG